MNMNTTTTYNDYQFSSRLQRALTERIYVVGSDADRASFEVQGNSEMTYDVELLPLPVCNCQDFVFRHSGGRGGAPCKHILNVVVRVLRLDHAIFCNMLFFPAYYRQEVIRAINTHKDRLVDFAFDGDDEKKNKTNSQVVTTPKNDEECAVCFESFSSAQSKSNWTCTCCGHRLHQECWRRWRKRAPTCPFCRHQAT